MSPGERGLILTKGMYQLVFWMTDDTDVIGTALRPPWDILGHALVSLGFSFSLPPSSLPPFPPFFPPSLSLFFSLFVHNTALGPKE